MGGCSKGQGALEKADCWRNLMLETNRPVNSPLTSFVAVAPSPLRESLDSMVFFSGLVELKAFSSIS